MSARGLRRAVLAAGACLLLPACATGTDHERMGDRRYAERAFVDALAEYRLAARQHQPNTTLRAKLGLSALHVGALDEAVRAYREMAETDPAAGPEAADGLVRAARLAVDAHDPSALRGAIAALRAVAPERGLTGLGGGLSAALDPERRSGADADVILAAAAVRPDAAGLDSLLVLWGDLVARSGRCDVATRVYDAVLRRGPVSLLARAARGGEAGCAVEAGRAALGVGHLEEAEAQLRRAIAFGVPDSTVRVAWLLVGDARWAGGDTAVALEAYRKAVAGGDRDDPVVQRAEAQMQKLLGGGNPQP